MGRMLAVVPKWRAFLRTGPSWFGGFHDSVTRFFIPAAAGPGTRDSGAVPGDTEPARTARPARGEVDRPGHEHHLAAESHARPRSFPRTQPDLGPDRIHRDQRADTEPRPATARHEHVRP